MIDALLSRSRHVVGSGGPGALWAKTKGTAREVRVCGARMRNRGSRPAWFTRVIASPQRASTMTPEQRMTLAGFMHAVGGIKRAASSGQDLFFPEIDRPPGS